jgi:hypothetical protein
MRSRLSTAVWVLLLCCVAPGARAQRGYANKLPVRQVEAALVMETGALKVRLTMATGEAIDYEVRDEDMIAKVLKFIEVSSATDLSLQAEVATDGRTLRALHLGPPELRPKR